MRRAVSLKPFLRRSSRGERLFFVILAAIFLITGPGQIFEPYDWGQKTITAVLNSKPYDGDGLVIAIDEETLENLPEGSWTPSDLARLLEKVRLGDPDAVAIETQHFEDDEASNVPELLAALSAFSEPPLWQVNVSSDTLKQIDDSLPVSRMPDGKNLAVPGDDEFEGIVDPTMMPLRRTMFPAPIQTVYRVATDQGTYPSTANKLAKGAEPQKNAFLIDLSYDPASVRTVSAADVLREDFDVATLTGKQIIIAPQHLVGRDFLLTPQSHYTPRAAITLLAARTLIDGPPLYVGWLPGLLFAIAGGAAWFFLKKPYGRQIAVVAFLALFLSPLFLEQALIYQMTSTGLAFLVFLFLGKVWQKSGRAVRTYRNAAETKSRFLAQASHDLRQPIHAIGLLADRLTQTELTNDQRSLVAKISWSVDNASRMFRALLDIAAIESGALETNPGPVSINDLLAEVDNQNALAAEESNVEIRLVPCDLTVETDRALVGTMLQNLVSNAIKYSRGGRVVVGCRRQGGRLSIYVVDSGQGISKEELKLVTKDFYRSSRSSLLRSDNKGLGLAIVSRLASMLDLKFVLASEKGKGTSATIEGLKILPAASAEPVNRNVSDLPLSGLRVFIADDDREALHSTKELLEAWGCAVNSSTTFPVGGIDEGILLSDFDFGNGDTLKDHADQIAQLEHRGVRIGVISGHHPDQIRSDIPGFSGLVLSKPLRTAELRSALMSLKADNKTVRDATSAN